MKDCRYIIGIDLGTTNCAVYFVDTAEETAKGGEPAIRVFHIQQLMELGVTGEQPMLPSLTYIAVENEFPAGSLKLPWNNEHGHIVGRFAGKRGSDVPARLITSAKSWLCHPHLDRNASILPWNAPDSVARLSPVDVSALYLNHIKDAWNHLKAADPMNRLENQDVYLAVPASFDAVARDLTVKAARRAGIEDPTLIEEPQAAFYAWLGSGKTDWRKTVGVGDVILVCDIGGGTTDFSLIEVREEEGDLALERIAVGDHILLGGDNMDLMLAFAVKKHFTDKNIELDNRQFQGLVYNCRIAKERVLNEPETEICPVVILGRGRSVIGGALQTSIRRGEVEETVLEGFFPPCSIEAEPARRRVTGLREIGLAYESDTGITRHMANFLRRHRAKGPAQQQDHVFLHPTHILFNGGVTKSSFIRNRIMDVLNGWLSSEGGTEARVLAGDNPDFAVAIGAAYYGLTKREGGIRVRSGASRTYYVGIETAMPAIPGLPPPLKALCVVPFGMEEGTDAEIPGQEFGVVTGEQAVFRFFGSTVRNEDPIGLVIEEWTSEEIEELAPLETTLTAEGLEPGTVLPVRLHTYVTEVGTLELWCESIDATRRWKLEFNVREEE